MRIPFLRALSLAFLIGISQANAQDAIVSSPQPQCGPFDQAEKQLHDKYHEISVTAGQLANGYTMVLFSSPNGETWTILYVSPEKIACVISNGEHLLSRPKGQEM
ncbi:hypothetical protein LJR231_003444 [Phyllobacterium sp. LjRoot231]|uniref:hypothetical protein n=1 Tax=Phyllobacterium sp. LjRoot231 TaxID=3342289 RepID=UPI003ED0FE4A